MDSAIYDFLKTPNKDNHNSQLSNFNFSFFCSTQAFIGQAKDYNSHIAGKQQAIRKETKWNDDNPPEATKFATNIKKSAHNGTAFKNIHYSCPVVPRRTTT